MVFTGVLAAGWHGVSLAANPFGIRLLHSILFDD
jgi:hypothetical protein